jgi:hypothetical protein
MLTTLVPIMPSGVSMVARLPVCQRPASSCTIAR